MALLDVQNLAVSFITRNGTNKAVDGSASAWIPARSPPSSASPAQASRWPVTACWGWCPRAHRWRARPVRGPRPAAAGRARQLREIRGRDIAMIFQGSDDLPESLHDHRQAVDGAAALPSQGVDGPGQARALELLEEVGIRDPESTIDNFPAPVFRRHAPAGDDRHGLINEPKLLIADEPTTALDVTIQAQILKLIAELQHKRDIGVIFISHDLAVVADIADTIVVMKQGQIVETGNREGIFRNARHPYTKIAGGDSPIPANHRVRGLPSH